MKVHGESMRMCAGCRQLKPKSELFRIVLDEKGARVDETGRQNGRGVYVCRATECIARMQKTKKTRIAGNNAVTDDIFAELRKRTGDG